MASPTLIDMDDSPTPSSPGASQPLAGALPRVVSRLLALGRGGDPAVVPSGFAEFDESYGGFAPGQLTVIGARPGVGRTILMLGLAREAALRQGRATAVFAVGEVEHDVIVRMLSAESGVSTQVLRRGSMSATDKAAIATTATHLSTSRLHLGRSHDVTVDEIASEARRLHACGELDFLVIDNLQQVSVTRGGDPEHDTAQAGHTLKCLAQEFNIPVVAGCSLSRKVEHRRGHFPLLADLSGGGQLEYIADVVILLHRDELYERFRRPNEVDLFVAKHRHAPTRTCVVEAQFQWSRVVDRRVS